MLNIYQDITFFVDPFKFELYEKLKIIDVRIYISYSLYIFLYLTYAM